MPFQLVVTVFAKALSTAKYVVNVNCEGVSSAIIIHNLQLQAAMAKCIKDFQLAKNYTGMLHKRGFYMLRPAN